MNRGVQQSVCQLLIALNLHFFEFTLGWIGLKARFLASTFFFGKHGSDPLVDIHFVR